MLATAAMNDARRRVLEADFSDPVEAIENALLSELQTRHAVFLTLDAEHTGAHVYLERNGIRATITLPEPSEKTFLHVALMSPLGTGGGYIEGCHRLGDVRGCVTQMADLIAPFFVPALKRQAIPGSANTP